MTPETNPKLAMLIDEIEDCMERDESVIVWARFHAEIADIVRALREKQISCVEYHGNVSQRQRQIAIDAFQNRVAGGVRVFVGQQAAGGTGITLTAASTVIYYSNTWSLEDRLQSEDRAHRIGQRKQVRYIDILAQDSIDGNVVSALRAKTDLAKTVLGDNRRMLEMLS
jgi:SNF2 family DNA or RNA helicase